MNEILEIAAILIYGAMALSALLGAFFVVKLFFKIKEKRFRSVGAANDFLEQVNERMQQSDFEGVAELCDSPAYWSKATPQLILVAMQNLDRPISKIRRMLGERMEREILASLESGMSWVATVVKTAPMLGLLGTVTGMIQAFAQIAASQGSGADPKALADNISFALATTAMGLAIAIPLVIAGNLIHVGMGKLQDSVQDELGRFFDDLEEALPTRTGGRA